MVPTVFYISLSFYHLCDCLLLLLLFYIELIVSLVFSAGLFFDQVSLIFIKTSSRFILQDFALSKELASVLSCCFGCEPLHEIKDLPVTQTSIKIGEKTVYPISSTDNFDKTVYPISITEKREKTG